MIRNPYRDDEEDIEHHVKKPRLEECAADAKLGAKRLPHLRMPKPEVIKIDHGDDAKLDSTFPLKECCWNKGCAFRGIMIVDGYLYCGMHGRLNMGRNK